MIFNLLHISYTRNVLQEFLVNFLLGQRHPLINGQSTIIPWIILLEQSLELILSWNSKRVLQRSCQELLHHGWELCHLDDTVLVSIMISEDLQHVPVQLQGLSTARIVNSSLNECLILVNTSLINDWVRIHGSSLGSDVLPTELQPLIKSDDPGGLEIHGVKHLLPCCILCFLCLVQVRISRSISIGPWH